MSNKNVFIEHILDVKKARLIEHNLSFEELKFCKNFSDDEITP